MHYVTDLHLHSKYSRAVSPQMTLQTMSHYAKLKGLDILSASDFTHPFWFKELRSKLIEKNEGLYQLEFPISNFKYQISNEVTREPYFLLSTEIACIYKHKDKLRRIHNLVFAPSLEVAAKINGELLKRGCNLSADGRPIIGLSSKHLLELILTIDERSLLIPVHIWTPHFGIYGSASGYDSLEECFEELTPFIYGIETGISSDPEMNWMIPELDTRSILSFSDAHSAPKMGREVTVMDLREPSYESVRQAIMSQSDIRSQLSGVSTETRNPKTENRIVSTVEFYPEEGKYHFSGHRKCGVSYGPEQIREKGNICPVCKRKMTEGVFYRLEDLAGEGSVAPVASGINEGLKWYTDKTKIHPPYIKLVPLNEIIAEALKSTVNSKKVMNLFAMLCQELGTELNILLDTPLRSIEQLAGQRITEGIQRVREGNLSIIPGYDGEYGVVKIWSGLCEA